MSVIVEELRAHKRAGHDLIPLHRWDETGSHRGKLQRIGKAPRDDNWPRRRYSDADLKSALASGCNFGVRLRPDQIVIDYDPRNDPDGEGWSALERVAGRDFLASCPRVNTGRGDGGRHLYCKKPANLPTRTKVRGFPGVDFKTAGAQLVAAGSRHPDTGGWYAWDDFSPPASEAPELPAPLLSLVARQARTPGGSDEPGQLTPDQLARVLSSLDPEEYADHDDWLRLGMASHHATAGEGVEAFVEWSARDDRYADDGDLIRDRWQTWGANDDEEAVTIGTLLHAAREAGAELGWIYVDMLPEAEPDPEAEPEAGPGPVGPNAPLTRLNDDYALVLEGSAAFVYELKGGPRRLKVQAFRDFLANRLFESPDGNVLPLADAWIGYSGRRQYGRVVFDPARQVEDALNTWSGWAVEPLPGARWDLTRELVFDVIAGGREDVAEYVLNWCAHMVQRPWEPAEVAIVLRGARGTGKSSFGRVLERIAGRHAASISHGLTAQFNAHLREAVLLVANEAFFAGDKAAESRLKSMITEPTLLYEPKGVDASMSRNCLHILMCSNEDWVIPAGSDERRFLVLEVSGRRSPEWWVALNAELDGDGVAGFMAHLESRDIDGWHPRLGIPSTSAMSEQKLASLDHIDLAWLSILRDGTAPVELAAEGENVEWDKGPIRVSKRALRSTLAAEMRGWRGCARAIHTQLGRRLRSRVPGLRVDGRARDYILPPLDDCRASFERALDLSVDWDA